MSNDFSTRMFKALALLSLTGSLSAVSVAQSLSTAYAPTPTPRIEIFGGYSYLYPDTIASGLLPGGILPVSSCLCAINKGVGASVTVPFSRWFGVTVDGSGHFGGQSGTPAQRAGNADAYNLAVGPQFKFRAHRLNPFVEALVGGDRLAPSEFHQDTAFGLVAGGGLDVVMTRHISARIAQADFVYSNHRFGPSATVPATNLRGLRLQAGVVFAFGGKAPLIAPVAAPAAVIIPKIVQAAPVDVVTLTAFATPAQINAGETSIITANGVSAQGRPLTYSFSTNEGLISGNNATALLTTAGLGAGTAIVTVNTVNDLGQGATQMVNVNLTVPFVPVEVPILLGNVSFDRDLRRPARVDNEAKALLDQTALSLQRHSDAALALIGYVDPSERGGAELAAQRAVNVKAYLVAEKGIDASRIAVYTGHEDTKQVSIMLVPAGANFDTSKLVRVDERRVKPHKR